MTNPFHIPQAPDNQRVEPPSSSGAFQGMNFNPSNVGGSGGDTAGTRPLQQASDGAAHSLTNLQSGIDKLLNSIRSMPNVSSSSGITQMGTGPHSNINGGGASFGGLFAGPNGGNTGRVPNPGSGHQQLYNAPVGMNGGQYGPQAFPTPQDVGNGGAAAAGALTSAYGMASAYGKRNMGDMVAGDYVSTRLAMTANGGYSHNQRNAVTGMIYGGGLNSVATSSSDMNQAALNLSNRAGLGVDDPRFSTTMRAAASAGITSPLLGATGAIAATLNQSTNQAYYRYRGMGVNTFNPDGTRASIGSVATQFANRSSRGGNFDALTPEQRNQALGQNGGLGSGLSSLVSQGVITQATADAQTDYLRGRSSALNSGTNGSAYDALIQQATSGRGKDQSDARNKLRAFGIDDSTVERLKDTAASRRDVQGDILPAFNDGLKTATGLIGQFNDALHGFLGTGPGGALGNAFGGASGFAGGIRGVGSSIGGAALIGRAVGGPGALGRMLGGAGRFLPGGVGASAGGGSALGAIAKAVPYAAAAYGGLKQAQALAGVVTGNQQAAQNATAGIANAATAGLVDKKTTHSWASNPITATLFGGIAGLLGSGKDDSGTGGPSTGGYNATGDTTKATGDGPTGAGKKVFPANGPITAPFGQTRPGHIHQGIDIGAPKGSPIWAAADGVVIFAGPSQGFGHSISIKHGDGVATLYGHMYSTPVRVGQKVTAGQVIANVGADGDSTGPHLHFEVHPGGQAFGGAVNPIPWLGGAAVGTATGAPGGANDAGSSNTSKPTNNQQPNSSGSTTGAQTSEAAAIASALSGGSSGSSSASTSQSSNSSSSGSTGAAAGSAPGNLPGGTGNNSIPALQAYAKQLLTAYGWGNQWDAFNKIVMSESGWLYNARSGEKPGAPDNRAYGIPQSLPANKMASAGGDWATNGDTQLKWMMDYIKSGNHGAAGFHDPNSAWAYHQSHNSYAKGSWEIVKDEVAQLHQGEMVVPKATASKLRDAVKSDSSSSGGINITFAENSIVIQSATAAQGREAATALVDALSRDQRIQSLGRA